MEYKIVLKRNNKSFKVGKVNRTATLHHQGRRGLQGIQGEKGDTGEQGIQGIQGLQGAVGPQGDQGVKGDKGDKGEKGNQGIQGLTGPKGEKGDQGETGARGPQGYTGVQGNTGQQGPQGIQGPKGDPGEKGDPGLQGIQGETGATGPQGPAGQDGADGINGADGADADWSDVSAATAKTTPVDADIFPILDSAASFGLKKITWANIKTGIFSSDVQLPDGFSFLFGTGGAQITNTGDRILIDGGGDSLQILADEIFLDSAVPSISLWNASARTLRITNDGGGAANLDVKSDISAGGDITGANLSGTNTGDQTLPVKASGAEINTGTDDAKFATAKAIMDSNVAFLSDIPSVPSKAAGSDVTTGTDDAKYTTAKSLRDAYMFPTKKARKMFYAYDDFINNVNSSSFLSTATSTGGVGIQATNGTDAIGISLQQTGGGSAGGAGMWSSQTNFVDFATTVEWTYETKIQVTALSNGTDRYQLWIGFIDNSFTESTDGCYFSYKDDVNSGKWELVTSSNGSRTRTDSGSTPSATTWYILRVVVLNVSGTLTARFYINDVQVGGDITSNVPTGTSRVCGYGNIILKTVGTNGVNLWTDYIEVMGIPTTNR